MNMKSNLQKKIKESPSMYNPQAESSQCIREINDLSELNALGCHYINTANHKNITRIITRSMRWLTVKQDDHFMTREQEKARKRIDKLTKESDSNINKNLNIRVLLDKDPREQPSQGELFDDTYIKKLIQIGADVRFSERESRVKLVLQDTDLYVSFSPESSKMVSIGYHYIGKNKDYGLCRFIADEFDKLFDNAQQLTLNNDKIILASSKWSRIKAAFKLTSREKVIIFISSIISLLIGLLPYVIKY